MATTKIAYGSTTGFTCTLTSLGSYASREGTIVANTSTLADDYIISGTIVMGAAVSKGDLYLLLSSSDGNNASNPATGSDASIVVPGIDKLGALQPGQTVPGTNLKFMGIIPANTLAAGAAADFVMGGVAAIFNGNPPNGGIAPVIVNCTGQALAASAGTIYYTAITFTTA